MSNETLVDSAFQVAVDTSKKALNIIAKPAAIVLERASEEGGSMDTLKKYIIREVVRSRARKIRPTRRRLQFV
jgi:hypothetical protein